MSVILQQPLFVLILLLIPVIWLWMRRSFLQGTSRKRFLLVGGLRSVLLLLLTLALTDPRLPAHSDTVNLFFGLDVSESIGSERRLAAREFLQTAVTTMDEDDQAGLIVFGKHPVLETSLRHDVEFHNIQSEVNPHFTNIAEMIQFAVGKFPQTGSKKIVLLTDGNENLQDAQQAAHLAASLGVQIFPVPLASWFGDREVFIKSLETPATIPLETPYEVRVVVMSSHAVQAELVVLKNDTLFSNETIELQKGKNIFAFADQLTESGPSLYKAIINCPNDVFFQNNEGLAFTRGTQKAQILYLSGGEASDSYLAQALQLQGLTPVARSLNELSGVLYELLTYNAIILDNISGQSMSFTMMENIETYVKDMGGGLIMIGGDQSFGAGVYKKTPIERALPVFMDAPTDLKFSALCLVFVIDKSSSMTTRYTDKTKLELAKIAAFSAVELLNPTDNVGIVAFDTLPNWTVPMTPASERQVIADKLTRLREGGGTDLYPALEDTFRVLKDVDANRKHVIVLSDGMTDEADFQSLVESMSASGISVSTAAIGADSDKELLKSIAEWGKGRYYYTDNPDAIPRIFTGETKIITKELIIEMTISPSLMMPHEILRGIDTDRLPPIYGQVITYPKPGSSVVLNTLHGPLLAAWQYGLGRGLAFTSDLSGRWGKDWVRWDHYGQFVAQMVKWTQRQDTQEQYMATIERNGEQATFTVDVLDHLNRFINERHLSINILFPSEHTQTFPLEQVAPGRYQSVFTAEEIGAYYISLFGTRPDDEKRPEVFGVGIPYTDEFMKTDVNIPLLKQLALITHGKVLSLDENQEDLFMAQTAAVDIGTALWPHITGLFLLFLLMDVAVRQVVKTF